MTQQDHSDTSITIPLSVPVQVDFRNVPGSNDRTYLVGMINGMPWCCSCPDFTFRRLTNNAHICKHMTNVFQQTPHLAEEESVKFDTESIIDHCRINEVPRQTFLTALTILIDTMNIQKTRQITVAQLTDLINQLELD